LWRNYNPLELATPEAFARDPKLVWDWYQWRRSEAAKATPNAAHVALAELAKHANDCLIVTQNVDNLHERADTPCERLVHVHGDLFLNRCQGCAYMDRTAIGDRALPPSCPRCSTGLLRPGVVWFGETLDPAILRRIDAFIRTGDCSLVLVVGTTATFQYIIDSAMRARGQKGLLVEVNPEQTSISELADVISRERAAEALPKLLSV
jgi:NAD-dependent deacetylase